MEVWGRQCGRLVEKAVRQAGKAVRQAVRQAGRQAVAAAGRLAVVYYHIGSIVVVVLLLHWQYRERERERGGDRERDAQREGPNLAFVYHFAAVKYYDTDR